MSRETTVSKTDMLPALVSLNYLLWKTDTKVTANVLKIRMQKCRVLCESIINGNDLVRRSRKHRLVEVLVKQRTK